ncbi:MAG: hypothetical protein JKY47_01010 [Thalassospira sp.]|jgi:uncharacterized phiE125 gp8 family phage protein|nr:hypothetical protein [Thalassospira sp.]PXX36277.1 putative phiE125 gp8 family phage protein [Thalassospira sp. 11-3]
MGFGGIEFYVFHLIGAAMDYSLVQTVAPATDFMEDARVYEHLRVPVSGSPAAPEDKDLIAIYRDGVQSHLDGIDGILGRALITQTWQMKLPRFPQRSCAIRLPLPPLQTVSAIEYIDDDGDEITLDSGLYQVVNRGKYPSHIVPAYSQTWPSTRDVPDAVTVTFVAGYGNAADDVPAAIRNAGLLLIGDLYEHREAQSVDFEIHQNKTVDWLLSPFRQVF